jgi:hypothetical protein
VGAPEAQRPRSVMAIRPWHGFAYGIPPHRKAQRVSHARPGWGAGSLLRWCPAAMLYWITDPFLDARFCALIQSAPLPDPVVRCVSPP